MRRGMASYQTCVVCVLRLLLNLDASLQRSAGATERGGRLHTASLLSPTMADEFHHRTYRCQRVDDQAVRHRVRLVPEVRRHPLEHRDRLFPLLRLSKAVDAHVDEDGVTIT